MGILGMVAIGFVVGLIAKFVMPGRDPSGFFATIAIGIVGSVVATFGGQALGLYKVGQTAGFLGSVVGAVVLLLLIRMVRR
ncbi:MAG: GlsB/YeaQ/YmgE family stress response membrane protein [Rhodospirillales bacterium]|nr:MAG: GlsB/YeaQ/YmgE family stress response membrane protein [Rhodospirillales bacterium]